MGELSLDLLSVKTMLMPNARFMADKIMPLKDAVEGYEIFDNMKAQKVVFKVD